MHQNIELFLMEWNFSFDEGHVYGELLLPVIVSRTSLQKREGAYPLIAHFLRLHTQKAQIKTDPPASEKNAPSQIPYDALSP